MLAGEKVKHCTTCYNEERSGRSHRQLCNDLWLRGEHRDLGLAGKIKRRREAVVVEKPRIDRNSLRQLLQSSVPNLQPSKQLHGRGRVVVSAWNKVTYYG